MSAGFDAYIVNQASCRASLLVATAGFSRDDWEDLRQQIILDCLRRMPKFDASRGDWRGFVRGVMRNHATVLVTRRSRRARLQVLAGDLLEPGFDEQVDPLDGIAGEEPTARFNSSLDVQRVLEQLPIQLRVLAQLLPDLPVFEICAATGRSRSRVYQMIRQIRVAFEEAGLGPCHGASPRFPNPGAGA